MSDPKIPQPAPCLDDDTMAALVAGDLSDPEAEALRAHVDACDGCHALAAAVARSAAATGSVAGADERPGVAFASSESARLGHLLARARARLRPGATLGRYVVRGALGEGGMATVYLADDPDLARSVALKVVAHAALDSEAQKRRLLREARVAAQLQHANVVTVFDVGQTHDATYLAMELVGGTSLRAYVGDASIPVERRLTWLLDVARALAAAHAQGLVHRDIKPENVMVRADGVIKVVDFGIARRVSRGELERGGEAMESTVTAREAVVGTPMYMAPEQLRGDAVDARCDQFSWGILAFELLTGSRPWSGRGVALVSQILTAKLPATRLPGLPAGWEAALRRATEKLPAARFPSMAELVKALESSTRPAVRPRGVVVGGWVRAAVGLALLAGVAAALVVGSRMRSAQSAALGASEPSATPVRSDPSAGPQPSAGTMVGPGEPPSMGSRWVFAPAATEVPPPTPPTTRPPPPKVPHSPASTTTPTAASAPPPSVAALPVAAREERPTEGAPSSASPRPAAACEPPYTWRNGVKIPKPECPLD